MEKAAEANANLAEGEDSVEVWVAAGIYTDYKGFVIRDRVRVLGGFPRQEHRAKVTANLYYQII